MDLGLMVVHLNGAMRELRMLIFKQDLVGNLTIIVGDFFFRMSRSLIYVPSNQITNPFC